MEKRFFIYTSAFVLVMVLIGFAHVRLFSFTDEFEQFIVGSYFYLISTTIAVCFLLNFLKKTKKFEHQIGYFYLFSVPLKIILFIIIFQKQFSDQTSNSKQELANCLFIISLTLIFEVLFMAKLLNTSDTVKNVE